MLSKRARVRATTRLKSRSDSLLLRRKSLAHQEGVRQQYVRIKQENACDGCGDVIDLADSDDERERLRCIAGRYNVHCISIEDGASAELIEFLSDPESCADDEADQSDTGIPDSSSGRDAATPAPHPTICDSTTVSESPRATVDLTRSCDLLCEYEQIYVDLALPSSSDDYESSDSSDGLDEDSGGDGADSDVPRALAGRRRVVSTKAPVDKTVLQKKIYTDISSLEMRKPWEFVYRCLDIPFESTPRSDACGFLFERWDDFWHEHGRAVWERLFWKPMEMNCEEYRQRHNRQCRAVKAFRCLADDLHEKFGLKLVELVQAKPHSGWWYRSKRPVNLVRLRRQDARLYALHLSRYRERWPFGVRHVRVHCNSCWCLPESCAANDKDKEDKASDDIDSDDSM